MKFRRWGMQAGRWHLTWWDSWARRPCFELVAGDWPEHRQQKLEEESRG
jgi:hypothetical protein